jgi:hypothetical protein
VSRLRLASRYRLTSRPSGSWTLDNHVIHRAVLVPPERHAWSARAPEPFGLHVGFERGNVVLREPLALAGIVLSDHALEEVTTTVAFAEKRGAAHVSLRAGIVFPWASM